MAARERERERCILLIGIFVAVENFLYILNILGLVCCFLNSYNHRFLSVVTAHKELIFKIISL